MTTAAGAATHLSTEQRREELAIVRRDYVDQGPEFNSIARERAHKLIDAAVSDAPHLTDEAYLLRLSEIASQADNAHDSAMVAMSPLRPAVRLPLRMIWLGDRLFVSRAAPGYGDLVGGEVLRIGRWTPNQMLDKLRRYQGGKDSYRRWNLSWITHNPAMLAAAGGAPNAERLEIQLRLPNGKKVSKTLTPSPAKDIPDQPFPVGWITSALSPDERAKGWTAISAQTPLYLQEPARYFRAADLPELDALYVQFRSNFDMGDEKIGPFVASIDQRLRHSPPRNFILDLRFDTGGDNTQNRALMRSIGERVPGRIFILTGPYTFSAGIASEAALIHDGGSKVTVIGEAPGDRTYWWSEHKPMCLPYSNVCMDRQMGHWELVQGCAGEAQCFSDQFDVGIRTLRPAIHRALTPSEWLSGTDPLLDAIRRILRHNGRAVLARNSPGGTVGGTLHQQWQLSTHSGH